MFTTENFDSVWKEISEYERDHFGTRFGADYQAVAQAIGASKHFMERGNITAVLAAFGLKPPAEGDTEWMQQPRHIHQCLAEIFYLGYRLGKTDAEVELLQKIESKQGN